MSKMKRMHLLLLLLSSFVVKSTAFRRLPNLMARRVKNDVAFHNSENTTLHRQLRVDYPTVLLLRGGGDDSIVVTKLQNVVRSLLQVLDAKLPILAAIVRTILGMIEKLLHIRLLPKPKSKSKSGGKKKKSPKRASAVHEDASKDDEEETTTTTAHKKTAKKSSSSSKKKKPTSKHLAKPLSSKSPNYRIQKELKEFLQNPPPNLKVKVGSNIRVWIVQMQGTGIYEGESFRLRISFPPQYPTVPPSVYFLPPTPQHEHVYTNGDICLSLLGKGWQPQMTAQSIAVSILSILSSAQTKSLPMDNAQHSQNKPGQYQKDWIYHDDNC